MSALLMIVAFSLFVAASVYFQWRDDRRKAERHVTEREIKHKQLELEQEITHKQLELMDQTTSFKIGGREYTVHREDPR